MYWKTKNSNFDRYMKNLENVFVMCHIRKAMSLTVVIDNSDIPIFDKFRKRLPNMFFNNDRNENFDSCTYRHFRCNLLKYFAETFQGNPVTFNLLTYCSHFCKNNSYN